MIGQAGCRRGLDSAACYDPASIIPPTPSLWGVAGTAGRVYQSPESPAQFAGESVMWVGWGGVLSRMCTVGPLIRQCILLFCSIWPPCAGAAASFVAL